MNKGSKVRLFAPNHLVPLISVPVLIAGKKMPTWRRFEQEEV
jgi:hypothetical protein